MSVFMDVKTVVRQHCVQYEMTCSQAMLAASYSKRNVTVWRRPSVCPIIFVTLIEHATHT